MATNLLNDSIYNYYGISDKLKNLDFRDNYQSNMYNYYSNLYPTTYNNTIFGGQESFLNKYSNYGLSNILDAVALGTWQEGLNKNSGKNLDSSGLGSVLYTLSGTHLDSLNYDDKWLRTQAGAVMKASELLQPYVTRNNQDGTYNITLPGGTDLGITTNTSREVYDAYANQFNLINNKGLSNSLSFENVKLFNDIDAAYNYVRNESSFLRSLKENALSKSLGDDRVTWEGELSGRSQANTSSELNYAAENDLKNRRSKVDQYKRNKASSQRLSATSAGGSGIGGSNDNDELKLGIPNLLGL